MSKTNVTERGVTPSPLAVVRVTGGAAPRKVDVEIGRSYDVRTDAEAVDDDNGAVTYPLVFVGEGGTPAGGLSEGQGAPVSKMTPLRVTPTTRQLLLACEDSCNVWVLLVIDRDFGDCGCGCGGGVGPLPEETSCGCRRR